MSQLRRRPLVLALLLATGAFAALRTPLDDHADWRARLAVDGRELTLQDRSGSTCLECHAAIGEEWAHSAHATAWQDELYQKALKKVRRKQGCQGCHVPVNLHAAGLPQSPQPRAENRHLGVSCEACHVAADGETILGPAGHATGAHPTEASELFDADVSNALCIACHATHIGPVLGVAADFVETEQAELGNSCVGCHMPRVRRPWAESGGTGGEPPPSRKGRSHRLETPRDPVFLARAFDLEAEGPSGSPRLVLTNLAGHRVPGLQERELTFTLVAVDASGAEVGRLAHTLDSRRYLPADGQLALDVPVQGRATVLRVSAVHLAPGFAESQTFLEREFALD